MNKGYIEDLKKVYIATRNDEIEIVNDFCVKYEDKLGVEHIKEILTLFYGEAYNCEQNEFIATVLNTIVKKYGQNAVNEIISNSDILFLEESENCITYLISMILFWNPDMKLDIVSALIDEKDTIKKMYFNAIRKKLKFVYGENKEILQKVLEKIKENQ